jgi:hypothetical protein
MHSVLKFLGAFYVVVAAATVVLMYRVSLDSNALFESFGLCLPHITGGIIIFSFGIAIEHLAAVRASTERQVELFESILARRSPPERNTNGETKSG